MYNDFQHLRVSVDEAGVAIVTIGQAMSSQRQHWELGRIWQNLSDDDRVKVVVTTGQDDTYLAGPMIEMLEEMVEQPKMLHDVHMEARDLVHNMINFDKPVIAAVNGAAYGHGLGFALMSDITVVAEDANLLEGHHSLGGVAAGDHATLMWPWLLGLGKTKYHLFLDEPFTGKMAQEIGLMNESLPADQVLPRALELAAKIAAGPNLALQATKRSLNQWLRLGAHTAFDLSLALEMLQFYGDDSKKALADVRETGLLG